MPASIMMTSEELFEKVVEVTPEIEWRNAQRAESINGDFDIIDSARAELRFLKLVDCTPALQDSEVLERAVDRYFEQWLPLVNEFIDSPDSAHSLNCYLLPPLDCACIWHCHKLNPVQYVNDCQHIFGKLLDVKALPGKEPSDSELRKYADRQSIKRWETAYPDEPYHFVQPFEDGNSPEFQELLNNKRSNRINPGRLRYDLIAAAQRQFPFYYQVSAKWFWDRRFLGTALQRYKGFLYLIKKSQEKPAENGQRPFFVPTYDIDLLWHTHQLSPSSYASDMKLFLGRLLEHDDTVNDRTPGQKLSNGFADTCETWFRTFGRVYEQAGGMYRGPAPIPAPPIPLLMEDEESKLLSLTKKGRWNTDSFTATLNIERSSLKLDDVDSRSVMQVNLVLLGAKNIPRSSDLTTVNQCYVRVTALAKCPILDVRTSMKEFQRVYDEVEWNEGLSLEAESSTHGLRLQLMRSKFRRRCTEKKPHGQIRCISWGHAKEKKVDHESDNHEETILDPFGTDEILGQLDLTWPELLRARTGLSDTKWCPVFYARTSSGAQSSGPVPHLHYSVSLTPPISAPKLFRFVQSPVTDDNCQIVALRLREAPGNKKTNTPQVGRWITKIVVNHLGQEMFVLRTKSEETLQSSGPSPMIRTEDMEKDPEPAVINVHNGAYKDFKQGKILGSALQLKKSDNQDIQQWSLFEDAAILAVHRPMLNRALKVKIYGECGPYRMRLIPGARLQFEETNDMQMTSTLTLVRYTPDSPLGLATALINLKAGSIAVMPGESVVLALLISAATYRSLYDFDSKHAIDPTINWRVQNTTLPKLGTTNGGNMGAVVLHNIGLSSRWNMIYPREERPKLLYERWHTNTGHDMAGTLCSAASCSGTTCGGNTCGVVSGSACGPGSQHGSQHGGVESIGRRSVGFGDDGRG
ncbi:hypothetical protein MPTK2_4g04810 [Marchantia polymorpha subsp. ruderalis]